jgi:hypothetical protein
MHSLFSALTGDPAGPDPAVPLGNGIAGTHGAQQGPVWQVLLLLFAVSLLVGGGVLLFTVAERTRLQARRRARRYGGEAVAVMPAPLLQTDHRTVVAVMKDDWHSVGKHTKAFWQRVRENVPGWPAELARQAARFRAVLRSHMARITRRASAERATGEVFPDKVPTSALAIPVRADARAHQGERTRVSA